MLHFFKIHMSGTLALKKGVLGSILKLSFSLNTENFHNVLFCKMQNAKKKRKKKADCIKLE